MRKLFKPATEAELSNRPPVPKDKRAGAVFYLDVRYEKYLEKALMALDKKVSEHMELPSVYQKRRT